MGSTYLGFDFGMKHIGVAVGQNITKTAKPLTSLRAKQGEPRWDEIAALIKEWQPAGLVVGIPLNMDGTEQPLTQHAKKFITGLKQHFDLPIHEVDERLTTIDAKQSLFDEGGYRALKKDAVDSLSACVILQDWLCR
ncbi:MAG: Holliday junction resolvase RuvX [Gammaproteobacteria bacterium]